MLKKFTFILLLTICYGTSNAQQVVGRKELLSLPLGQHTVDNVQVKEIMFNPGQRAPRHLHPCPIVGYVAEGSVIYQIEGKPAQTLHQGDAFYEPANTAIARFDNASTDKPLKFIAFYLANGDQPLIQMLPASDEK